MGRARSEDRLGRVMELFWANGYYDTSVDELMGRTGLHRAAVYGEFGSKQGLFEATLHRYRETIVSKLVAPLAEPDAARAEIDRFFGGILHAAGAEKRRGCLMINTASEVSPHIGSVARIVTSFLEDLRVLLHRACVNARTRGEIRAETNVDQVADYLVGSVLGLWSLGRSPAPAKTLRHYVAGVLGSLDGLRPEARGRLRRNHAPGAPDGAERPRTMHRTRG
jgi:TetR/AcrR family transcriptional regulator, transcriptional repressor for nem operon